MYVEAEEKGFEVGEALYKQLRFFCNESVFIDKHIQNKIRKYQYCKVSNTPPYRSLQDTPASFVDDYLEIHHEIEMIKATMKRDYENAK